MKVKGGRANAPAPPRAFLGRRCMGKEFISGREGLRKFCLKQTLGDQLLGARRGTVRFLLITNLERE
jgi:hypothetical protein